MSAKHFNPASVPSPEDLLEFAADEIDRTERTVPLESYLDTIELLREKEFSWRKIADFFKSKGIDANHNELYYVARKAAITHPDTDEVDLMELDDDKKLEDRDAGPIELM